MFNESALLLDDALLKCVVTEAVIFVMHFQSTQPQLEPHKCERGIKFDSGAPMIRGRP